MSLLKRLNLNTAGNGHILTGIRGWNHGNSLVDPGDLNLLAYAQKHFDGHYLDIVDCTGHGKPFATNLIRNQYQGGYAKANTGKR